MEPAARFREYFESRKEVVMAFLFGSCAKGLAGTDSDLDLAVYFDPGDRRLEWDEPNAWYDSESGIWADLEAMVGRNVDLLVLNRAAPTVAESAIRGTPIIIRDRGIYLDFLVTVSYEATDFREWMEDYWRLKERSRNGTRR